MDTLKDQEYICPKCRKKLINKKKQVYFIIVNDNGNEGIIYLSPKVGDYDYSVEGDVPFKDGDLLTFLCPHCKKDLKSNKYPEYVSIKMNMNDMFDFDVLFSRKAGMKRTYVITEDEIERYGDDYDDEDIFDDIY
ncbi:MAG: hypothetical protein D6707_08455 [Bacteroidetes bacterium]|nr:MAG: hypothetical protein D6707_08455 [Bacteroidota bacterium]